MIQYLHESLCSDALNANHVITAISHGVVYSLLSILVTAFDPSRFNSQELTSLILKLVSSEVIANVIWKEGLDSPSGLAGHIGSLMSEFPANFLVPVKLMESLSMSSSNEVFEFLNSRDIFAEYVEDVQAHFIAQRDYAFINVCPRQKLGIALPKGMSGSSPDGKFYMWKVSYSGFRVMLHQIDQLIAQLVQGGAKNISVDLMECVVHSLHLFENLLKKSPTRMSNEGKSSQIKKSCLALVERFAHVPNPPLQLLAACLR